MYSVSQVIEQLLVQNTTNPNLNDSETICECSIGSLKFNSVTDFKYEPVAKCSKKAICYFIATEKHKARISTKHFLRHKEYNERRKAKQKTPAKVAKQEEEVRKSPQKNLLEYFS
jgi:hypothetical protein